MEYHLSCSECGPGESCRYCGGELTVIILDEVAIGRFFQNSLPGAHIPGIENGFVGKALVHLSHKSDADIVRIVREAVQSGFPK